MPLNMCVFSGVYPAVLKVVIENLSLVTIVVINYWNNQENQDQNMHECSTGALTLENYKTHGNL